MVEHEIPIRTADGEMTTFVVHPEGDAPFPVAVVFIGESDLSLISAPG